MPTAQIAARDHWNSTGIHVVAGQKYRLRISGEWSDAGHRCGAEGWSGTALTNAFTVLRRARSLPWFALVGSVDKKRPYVHLLGESFTALTTGELYCFANDAYGFYRNN